MYNIDRNSDVPLYAQIRDSIESAVKQGTLKPGDRLPSVSSLAKEIGVTQATIRRALQDLAENGMTDSHVGRGTFIRDSSTDEIPVPHDDLLKSVQSRKTYGRTINEVKMSATKRMRSGVTKALCDIMPLAHKSGVIQLTQGVPDPALLPDGFLDKVCADALSTNQESLIQATEPQGMWELRAEIAKRESGKGVNVTPEQVLITNGVSQAVTLIGQSLLDSEFEAVCESPCFLGIANTLSAMGHWVESVRRDEEGADISELERMTGEKPKLLYVCPYVHNPTGLNMSMKRVVELAAWARKTGSIIIADEIFRDLAFKYDPALSIFSELGAEQTIVVNSLSKTVMTGMRLGWIIASPSRIKELAGLKKLMDQACPTLIQAMATSILRDDKYDHLVSSAREIYKTRMATMLNTLEKHMPGQVGWTTPEGGFSMMLKLPPGYSSVALLLFAVEKGVSFLPGPLFDIDHRYVNCLRLSCAWADELQIKEGVELLADAVSAFISRPPEDAGLGGLGGTSKWQLPVERMSSVVNVLNRKIRRNKIFQDTGVKMKGVQLENVVLPFPDKALDGIVKIFNYYIEHSFAAYRDEKITVRQFSAVLESAKGYPGVTVRDSRDEMAGFGFLTPHKPIPTFSHSADFTCFLLPEFTSRGVGGRILDYLEKSGAEMGIENVFSSVSSKNVVSLTFHLRKNFTECGRFRDVGRKDGEYFDTVWMQKKLQTIRA